MMNLHACQNIPKIGVKIESNDSNPVHESVVENLRMN